MLMDRIVGAFTFRKGIYREVEEDASFTGTAWLLVAVVAFLNQLGGNAAAGSFAGWLIGTIVGTLFIVIGFAVAILVINFVGRTFFNAQVTFEELVRTLGLAYVWNIIGVIGIVAFISPALGCVVAPAILIATILGIVAWFIAVKEARSGLGGHHRHRRHRVDRDVPDLGGGRFTRPGCLRPGRAWRTLARPLLDVESTHARGT
jgi:asparagine N-glycosylation enzyme membrane subunit Stt3